VWPRGRVREAAGGLSRTEGLSGVRLRLVYVLIAPFAGVSAAAAHLTYLANVGGAWVRPG
jgi:hypothetical protein